jgi:hypothetical protein
MLRRAFAFAAAIGLAFGFVGVAHATEYTLTTTWNGGQYASAGAWNASGQIAGTVNDAVFFAVVWDVNGGETVLSTPDTYVGSGAGGINASGQSVGAAWTLGAATQDALRWSSSGQPTILTGLGGSQNGANAISDSGQVIGTATTPGDAATDAVTWSSTGKISILKGLGGTQSSANAINASGEIVGSSTTAGNATQEAVRWSSSGVPTILGTGVAVAINASGEIAGDSGGNAVVWSPTGRETVLGSGQALGINASGQVLGVTSKGGVVWDSSGVATYLNPFLVGMPGIFDASEPVPALINDEGDILGTSFNDDCCDEGGYQTNLWLLTPVAAPVPEPSTILLVAAALSAWWGVRWVGRKVVRTNPGPALREPLKKSAMTLPRADKPEPNRATDKYIAANRSLAVAARSDFTKVRGVSVPAGRLVNIGANAGCPEFSASFSSNSTRGSSV